MRGPFRSLLVVSALLLSCQAQGLPGFDAASIRPHPGSAGTVNGRLTITGTRLNVEGYSLLGLIMFAYSVKNFRIVNAASLDHTMYDIAAVADASHAGNNDEFRLMMQSLLAERFKLRAHWESRETPVYALVIGRNGPRFRESAPDASTTPTFRIDGTNVVATIPSVTMERLAERIRDNAGLDRPVIDQTGLSGSYAITLSYTPESRRIPGQSDPNEINIFTAVQKQLGLRLERQTIAIQMLVIDHSERASDN